MGNSFSKKPTTPENILLKDMPSEKTLVALQECTETRIHIIFRGPKECYTNLKTLNGTVSFD